jgi:hypothetical protein
MCALLCKEMPAHMLAQWVSHLTGGDSKESTKKTVPSIGKVGFLTRSSADQELLLLFLGESPSLLGESSLRPGTTSSGCNFEVLCRRNLETLGRRHEIVLGV